MVKKNIRQTKPRENVRYTFLFVDKATLKKKTYSFIYCGTNAKERLIFRNLTTNSYTSMSAGWFSTLHKRQLVSETEISTNATETSPKTSASMQQTKQSSAPCRTSVQTPESDALNEMSFEERTIYRLRTLSDEKAVSVNAKIGYSAAELADNLEKIMKDKQNTLLKSFVDKTFSDLMQAQDVYLCSKSNFKLAF